MAKKTLRLKATTFNNEIIYPKVDDIHILINKNNTILSLGIYNELKNKIKNNLKVESETSSKLRKNKFRMMEKVEC